MQTRLTNSGAMILPSALSRSQVYAPSWDRRWKSPSTACSQTTWSCQPSRTCSGTARPPLDHRYTVNERGKSSGDVTKNVNVLRDIRAGRAAHNGLVAGSISAEPNNDVDRLPSPFCGPMHRKRLENLRSRAAADRKVEKFLDRRVVKV